MRGYWWTRRSLHFGGLIPHSGVAYQGRFRHLLVMEYIPPKSKLGTVENVIVLFFGRYRVWEFRAVCVRRFDSMVEVEEYLKREGVQPRNDLP